MPKCVLDSREYQKQSRSYLQAGHVIAVAIYVLKPVSQPMGLFLAGL